MREKTLIKISLITTLAGILVLLFASRFMMPESSDASMAKEGKDVKIDGIVRSVKVSDSVTVIEISDECSIKAVFFGNIDAKGGQRIEVNGRVEQYRGDKEIVAEEVRVW